MLVLSRKLGQVIRIGDGITIAVVETGSRIKLGIDAPPNVRVLRDEVTDRQFKPPPLRKRLKGGER